MAFGRGASSASTGNTGHESSCHPRSDCGDLLGLETHILEIERTNMTFPVRLFVCAAILVALNSDRGLSQDSSGKSFYLIGNSLTWDTVPQQLDGDTQWHVDCGVSLPYIHANPAKPCVKQSTIWPKALRDKQYDVVSVQPHSGFDLVPGRGNHFGLDEVAAIPKNADKNDSQPARNCQKGRRHNCNDPTRELKFLSIIPVNSIIINSIIINSIQSVDATSERSLCVFRPE